MSLAGEAAYSLARSGTLLQLRSPPPFDMTPLPPKHPQTQSLQDNVFEALASFFCASHGLTTAVAAAPAGPVATLLASVRAAVHQPRPALLAALAGAGPQPEGRLATPAAWRFVRRVLRCLRALQGRAWPQLLREWGEAQEGVGLPLAAAMDLLANLYNTDEPALLGVARQRLLPLVRAGRRGPALDLDALLLVLAGEWAAGACPVSPLTVPRRLTSGTLAAMAAARRQPPALPPAPPLQEQPVGGGGITMLPVLSLAASGSLAAAAGLDPYPPPQQRREKSPMRRRIVNLAADVRGGDGGSSSVASPESPLSLPPVCRSPELLRGMQELASSSPEAPLGLRSELRASIGVAALRGLPGLPSNALT